MTDQRVRGVLVRGL